MRVTQALIDTEALRFNIHSLTAGLPASMGFYAVVKANAYGHGAEICAKVAVEEGCKGLCVALATEGAKLRKCPELADIPIMILGEPCGDDAALAAEYGLTQTVCSSADIKKAAEAAKATGKTAYLQLACDTGMGRIGVRRPQHAVDLLRMGKETFGVEFKSMFTHLATADMPEENEYTELQLRRFAEITAAVEAAGLRPESVHAANTASAIRGIGTEYDAARLGIGMYGANPVPGSTLPLKPVMTLRTAVAYVKELNVGDSVSYGRIFRTERPTKLATLPIGYADGLPRLLSGKLDVLINGRRYRQVGRICMDQCMVDITGSDDIVPGTEVTIIGENGGLRQTAGDLAAMCGTIDYEIFTGINARVPRVAR